MIKVKEWHSNSYPALCFSVANNYEEDERNKGTCLMNLHFWKWNVYLQIPQLFKPREKWVDLSQHEWATVGRDGRKGYTEQIRKDYGFSFLEDSIHIHYGIQPGSWSRGDPENSDHTKVFWYPWQLEHVRHEILDLQQNIVYTNKEWDELVRPMYDIKDYKKAFYHIPDTRCTAFFKFYDKFNDCTVEARCHIEEREWHRGLWRWARAITRNFKWGRHIQRTLSVDFNEEVGKRKGSWKGGTTGCSMRLLPGETTDAVIKRFQETWE